MTAPKVPTSVLRASRAEAVNAPFEVVQGTIPSDLSGHLFFVAPVGTVASGGLPYPNPTTVMNGDGMVVRVDFTDGQATLTSRIVQTWDQRADVLTNDAEHLKLFRFQAGGIARLGLLGARDFANTAFQPFAAENEPARMLVTYDAGRPWEIDTQSLRAITPLGLRREWVPSALNILPFPLILSPAHPAYDPKTSELVTINYVRSFASILGIGQSAAHLGLLPKPLLEELELLLLGSADVASATAAARAVRDEPLGQAILNHIESLLAPMLAESAADSCRAMQWDGRGELKTTSLMLANGDPVVIKQSVHQIALTENHLILLDTGFKLGIAQLFNDPMPNDRRLDAFIRELLDKPQMDQTILYIVPRSALGKGVPAIAQQVIIPIEADHFLADYDDRDGTITVHVAHAPATDLAEWWRPYDKQFYTKEEGSYAAGFLSVGAMDVGRLGRYKIDAATGTVTVSKVLADDEKLWAISLYAGRHLGTMDPLPERIESLFWGSEGFFPDLLTDWVFDNYKDYTYRETPISQIREMGNTGRPSCINRLDTQTMTIADSRVLPMGQLTSSLQFVPRPESKAPHDGWLLCTVFTDARVELWILDGLNLNADPVILVSNNLTVGFTLHAAWLSGPLAARTATYAVSPEEDLTPISDPVHGTPDQAIVHFVRDVLLPELRKIL